MHTVTQAGEAKRETENAGLHNNRYGSVRANQLLSWRWFIADQQTFQHGFFSEVDWEGMRELEKILMYFYQGCGVGGKFPSP